MKALELSTSVATKVPPVDWMASVSVRAAVLVPLIRVPSSVPVMVIVTLAGVPSMLVTVKVSLTF
ncbi:hypothetical protein D3C86_2080420 [compost metagenome]